MSFVLYLGIVGIFSNSARAWAMTESLLTPRGCGVGRPCEKASTCRSRLRAAHLGHLGFSRSRLSHSNRGVQILENIANIRVPVIAAVEGRAHVHSEYALLADVIVAAEGATFHDAPHFAAGIVPGDGIFTTWSYRAGPGRAEAFLLNPQPITARTAHEWGVVAEVVPDGKALSRAQELAELYLKAPEVTRRNTRVHFIHPLKERIVREVGYGLSLEGASAADLVKEMQARSESIAPKGKVP
ncbi:MAG: enoyl-CoA hydratase/isomerase family protein [Candidatus Sulfotelmatobacter sp.]